ncbi:MAG: hypothetical protein GAK40_00021 [Burkholderia plantarii]|nr:MAG: hypothetical protein GAK40_00021 [Burkholderia plantarii]
MLRVAMAAFVALCAAAVGAAVAQHVDAVGAIFVGMLTAAGLWAAARHAQAGRVPAALRIDAGAQVLAAFDRSGACVVQGPVVSWAQWADRLLVLAVAVPRGRPVPLVVPADALEADAFRALSAFARRATRG